MDFVPTTAAIELREDVCRAATGESVGMADDGYDPGEIIRASIANGWQGLFEPKTKPAQKPLAGKSKARLNHLGVVEELQSFGGINSWASTGYTSIAEYEAAQKESA